MRPDVTAPPSAPWPGSTPFDVTDADAVERSVHACRDTVGVPTALFNNAGYQGRFERVDGYDHDDARRVFDVNVLGAFTVLGYTSRRVSALRLARRVERRVSQDPPALHLDEDRGPSDEREADLGHAGSESSVFAWRSAQSSA
jgi:NAD(P)-dependent dehydrogenase (short-subunit alcohol dehydrogenase family)